jgi:hypothetical protein
MDVRPIGVTHLNQILHLSHEAGVTSGFFKYYFLELPKSHPYDVGKVVEGGPGIDNTGVSSIKQLDWGLRRFYIDALLYFGNIRTAYRLLRVKSFDELTAFFARKRVDSSQMIGREHVIDFKNIPVDDRHLISEIACKMYTCSIDKDTEVRIVTLLKEIFRKNGGRRIQLKELLNEDMRKKEEKQNQMMLDLIFDDLFEEYVENEQDIEELVSRKLIPRFTSTRHLALANTRLYLSIVNELDVYVATSMRKRDDFRNMARNCGIIFKHKDLTRFKLRYFDPTMSAAKSHEDKGLIECLMVKCAKVALYFAGEGDSYGKDVEIGMAMSLGKPAIILCPGDEKGASRMRFFRDIHPLSRLIDFQTGVAVGSIVTQSVVTVSVILQRIFDNTMEYELEQKDGYFRLKEKLTGSVVRLQTNFDMLTESFWNNYHNVQ